MSEARRQLRPTTRGLAPVLVGLGALAYVVVVLVAPLLTVIEPASVELGAIERAAIARAAGRGLAMASVVALATAGLGLLCAWTVHPGLLLASLLVGRALVAQGVLGLGLEPGRLAAGLALVVDLLPFAALLLWLRLRTFPRELDEAAADLGAGLGARLRDVAWPHLRPGLIIVVTWTALQVLGDALIFELAGGGHVYTPGLLIRDALIREAAPGRAASSMLALVGLALICAWALARELEQAGREDWRGRPRAPRSLSALGYLVAASGLAIPLAAALAPLISEPGMTWGPSDRGLAALAGRSFGLAAILASLAAVGGLGLALLARVSRAQTAVALAVLTPLAIPPSVHGLLYLELATRLELEPGPALTCAALLGPALALGFVCGRLASLAVPRELVDAAADLGAGPRARLRTLWSPLVSIALALAGLVVGAWVLAQAAIPSFTSGPGGDTLAVALTIHARAGAMDVVGRWSLISLGAALACAALVGGLARRLGRRGGLGAGRIES